MEYRMISTFFPWLRRYELSFERRGEAFDDTPMRLKRWDWELVSAHDTLDPHEMRVIEMDGKTPAALICS